MNLSPDDIEKISARVAEMLELKADKAPKDLDWLKIKIPGLKTRKINQSGTISGRDYALMRVASKLLGKSVATLVQTAVILYLRRNAEEHIKQLDFVAGREGISREEAFEQIYSGKLKP